MSLLTVAQDSPRRRPGLPEPRLVLFLDTAPRMYSPSPSSFNDSDNGGVDEVVDLDELPKTTCAKYLPSLPVKISLRQNVQDMIKQFLEAVVLAFPKDDDKTSVSNSTHLVDFAEAINEITPSFDANHLQDVYSMVKQIREQDAIYQKDPEVQQDDVVGEELPEEGSMLIRMTLLPLGLLWANNVWRFLAFIIELLAMCAFYVNFF
ncbi:hypothetical protein M422DRAFT_246286 [Sphaerobolus stellatus SS14]|nr:hypothetical protein M422DRAFT_246286 [Sphaerobolus stellatus SS14]